MALTIYEAEQTRHGLPARLVYDDEMGTWLTVDDSMTDYADQALANYREKHKEIPAGTVLRVVLADGLERGETTSRSGDRTLGADSAANTGGDQSLG